jgi:hypothetical protein
MNCYICLEHTDNIIKPRCNCHIYSHVSCFKEWLQHKDSCLICNRQVSKNKYENYITFCIVKIFIWLQPIEHYLRQNNTYLELLFFLFMSFIISISMIVPLYILSFVSFLERRVIQDYKVINIKNDFYKENIEEEDKNKTRI